MGRILIVLFMLSLTSASAIACHDRGQIAQNHGDSATAPREFPTDSAIIGGTGATSTCVPLHRAAVAGQHEPNSLENSRERSALRPASWDVPLDRGQIPKQPRYRNFTPDKPSRFIPVAEGSAELETTMWRIVKESKNPADYEAYLDIFPKGRFAKQARESLARLRSKESGATPNKTRGQQPAPAVRIDRIEQNYTVRTTANLRQAPSIKSKIVGQVRKGQNLFVLGRAVGKNWYQISTAAGGVAYIAANLMEQRKSGARGPAIERKANRSKAHSADRKAAASRPAAPSSSAPVQQESRATQGSPDRKSPAEIEEHWNRRINLVKGSGPHGDCDLVVDDPRTDPAQYAECQERNQILESLKLQMDRELAGQR